MCLHAFVVFLDGGILAIASDCDEFKVKRESPFEFVQKPVVAREGDRVTIAFETKGLCDVTVAVEDKNGRIVRHLVSGVLGPNAPKPFVKNAKKQTVIWDGKDDHGRYVDDKDKLSTRVSLGLRARFERTLFWSPKRRTVEPWNGRPPQVMCRAADGIYVYDSGYADHVRLFDHKGEYVRTVHPLPADALGRAGGLTWHTFPQDGTKWPLKWGGNASTLLTCGSLKYTEPWQPYPLADFSGQRSVAAMAYHAGTLYLIGERMNRIGAEDGASTVLDGPRTCVTRQAKPRPEEVVPTSAAVSPDGRWLYLAGYFFGDPEEYGGRSYGGIGGVARIDLRDGGGLQRFVGTLDPDDKGGDESGRFRTAASVDVDPKGRVYVADYGNGRVQVFDAEGRHLKSIAVKGPALVRVDPKTGRIYVFQWYAPAPGVSAYTAPVKDRLVVLASFDNPEVVADVSLAEVFKYTAFGRNVYGIGTLGARHLANLQRAFAEIDPATAPPTIWLSQWKSLHYDFSALGVKLCVLKDGALEVKRDFAQDAAREIVKLMPPQFQTQRIRFNPGDGRLYVGENHQPGSGAATVNAFTELVAIEPETGAIELVPMPFDSEDLAFDADGNAYLRTADFVTRWDTSNTPWREMPFDYGDARPKTGHQGQKTADVRSGIVLPGTYDGFAKPFATLGVSPFKGHVIVACRNPHRRTDRRESNVWQKVEGYSPKGYPGRMRGWEIHAFDKHGKLLYEDVLPGVGPSFGAAMDRADNVYILTGLNRLYDGEPYANPLANTLVKARPGRARLISPQKDAPGSWVPLPLERGDWPDRPPDLIRRDFGRGWIENAEWLYGSVGQGGAKGMPECRCVRRCSFVLDYFARSFVPETDHYSVGVLDSAGNVMLRIGQYGNVDDGLPLVRAGGPPHPHAIGGDEVGLFQPLYLAAQTDRRVFIADYGNTCIRSVRLDYHATERAALKNIPDREAR